MPSFLGTLSEAIMRYDDHGKLIPVYILKPGEKPYPPRPQR